MTTVAEFVMVGDADAWRAVGFAVNDEGLMQVGGIRIRFVGIDQQAEHLGTTRTGIQSWVLADAVDPTVAYIDGLSTSHGEPPHAGVGMAHPNGVVGIDHVVVYTPDLERTSDALAAATAAPLKRIREVGALRQGFHRLGELIVEVVTFPDVPVGEATFWGLALNVRDIHALFSTYGEPVMSVPKDAVQPGRQIASFRDGAGLGLPVAVMTPTTR